MNGDKEQLICDKLVDMMEETSFLDIKVKDFVEYAGISRSTFYLYFGSLYDVLQEIEDAFMSGMFTEDETAELVKGRQLEALDTHFIIKVEYIERNKRLLRILLSENGDPSFFARLVNRYKRIITKVWSDNQLVSSGQIDLLAEYVSGGQIQALKWWVSHDTGVDLCDMMLTLERYLIALFNATDAA